MMLDFLKFLTEFSTTFKVKAGMMKSSVAHISDRKLTNHSLPMWGTCWAELFLSTDRGSGNISYLCHWWLGMQMTGRGCKRRLMKRKGWAPQCKQVFFFRQSHTTSLELALFLQRESPSCKEIAQLSTSAYRVAVGCGADGILVL